MPATAADLGLRRDEIHDAAQERGEAVGAHNGARKRVDDDNAIVTSADLGLRRDEIHDARRHGGRWQRFC